MARSSQILAAPSIALTALLAACGSSSSVLPAAPTSMQSPAPGPTVARERWNLTTTLKSFTGSAKCNVVLEAEVGETFLWEMTVERSGGWVRLIVSLVGDPLVRDEYEGPDVEDVLTAAVKGRSGKTVCEGAMVDVISEAHVSGRFSGDGRAVTAEELKSYTFTSGERFDFYYDWHAVRQRS